MATELKGIAARLAQSRTPGVTGRIDALLRVAINTQKALFIQGPPGVGKSSAVEAALRGMRVDTDGQVTDDEDGAPIRVVVFSVPNVSAESLGSAFLARRPDLTDELADGLSVDEIYRFCFLLHEMLVEDTPLVLLLDDTLRGESRQVLQNLLELLQEGTLMGQAIPGLLTTIAIDNPPDGSEVMDGDLAFWSRFLCMEATAHDFDWPRYLIGQARKELSLPQKGVEDLVKKWWWEQDENTQAVLAPRTLEHMLYALDFEDGLPIELCIPTPNGERMTIERDGRDVTDEVLDDVCRVIGVQRPNLQAMSRMAERVLRFAVTTGRSVRLVSVPGKGKTAFTKAYVREIIADMNLGVRYMSWGVTSSDAVSQAIPAGVGLASGAEGGKPRIVTFPNGDLFDSTDGTPFVHIGDEITRAPLATRQQLLSLAHHNRRQPNGKPTSIHTFIGLDNSTHVGTYRLDAGRIGEALAGRFSLTYELDPEGDECNTHAWLRSEYGQIGEAVTAWHSDHVPPELKPVISARALEMMCILHQNGLEIDEAFPFTRDGRVPIPNRGKLSQLLAGATMYGLRKIVDDVDDTVADLMLESSATGGGSVNRLVAETLVSAGLDQLEQFRPQLRRIVAALRAQFRKDLVTKVDDERVAFFSRLIVEISQETTESAATQPPVPAPAVPVSAGSRLF